MQKIVFLITSLAMLAFSGCTPRRQLDAMDPSHSTNDIEITRQIRQTLLEPNELSLSAKNVTIVTNSGDVTLVGRVTSDDERREVIQIARTFAGSARVNADLEVFPE